MKNPDIKERKPWNVFPSAYSTRGRIASCVGPKFRYFTKARKEAPLARRWTMNATSCAVVQDVYRPFTSVVVVLIAENLLGLLALLASLVMTIMLYATRVFKFNCRIVLICLALGAVTANIGVLLRSSFFLYVIFTQVQSKLCSWLALGNRECFTLNNPYLTGCLVLLVSPVLLSVERLFDTFFANEGSKPKKFVGVFLAMLAVQKHIAMASSHFLDNVVETEMTFPIVVVGSIFLTAHFIIDYGHLKKVEELFVTTTHIDVQLRDDPTSIFMFSELQVCLAPVFTLLLSKVVLRCLPPVFSWKASEPVVAQRFTSAKVEDKC
uniref:G_PROTEIN_RECEP_F1_2 domain-containing protein n=1 Tax=Steinernema glaseri TaxID=37863 RepID=A0A1I8AVK4_9BILA